MLMYNTVIDFAVFTIP